MGFSKEVAYCLKKICPGYDHLLVAGPSQFAGLFLEELLAESEINLILVDYLSLHKIPYFFLIPLNLSINPFVSSDHEVIPRLLDLIGYFLLGGTAEFLNVLLVHALQV